MPYSEQTVQSVRPWSDKTFSFTLTRPQDFAFENGEFVTIGLKREGRLVARAYSIVSTADRDELDSSAFISPTVRSPASWRRFGQATRSGSTARPPARLP